MMNVKIFEEFKFEGEDLQHKWRLCQAYNELCEAYIAGSRFEEAVEQADRAIQGYFALLWDSYPDWAMMNKGLALCNLGRHDEASTVLEEFLEYREAAYGQSEQDDESFK